MDNGTGLHMTVVDNCLACQVFDQSTNLRKELHFTCYRCHLELVVHEYKHPHKTSHCPAYLRRVFSSEELKFASDQLDRLL